MKTVKRCYNHPADYDRVGQFLVRTYSTTAKHINWLQPRWEYMHYHPLIENVDLSSIGIWEADGQVVAVVHPEHDSGTAFFQIDPEHAILKQEMLTHAEEHICAATDSGKTLCILINDRDEEFQCLAVQMGYQKEEPDYAGYTGFAAISRFVIPDPFATVSVPDGFRLISLAQDDDMPKTNRLLWRGFNHGGEPPDDGIEGRRFMQSSPNFQKDLNIIAVAPDGNFVSYAGLWYEPVNKIAYVEPVATDPDYRRRGLATAAILEGIRRCGQRGATLAHVGAISPVYLSLGFRQIFNLAVWQRQWQ